MSDKYWFTGETKEHLGHTLHRIQRIHDGVVGGWVESEANLSQKGNCFIYNEAIAMDKSRIHGNAVLSGYATASGDANVSGSVRMKDHSQAFFGARLSGDYPLSGYQQANQADLTTLDRDSGFSHR